MAISARKKPGNDLIHHSDRGIQYCSVSYVDILNNNRINISMTQSGSPYENALAERVNGTIKNEFFPKRIYQNYKDVKKAIKQIVEVYNKRRPHSSLNFLTPELAHEENGIIKKRWKTYPQKNKKIEELNIY